MKAVKSYCPPPGRPRAFTLIELLVVISIIGVLAAFTIPVLKTLKRQQYIRVARAELDQLATALENYKGQYGVYPPANAADPLMPQLYYELSGTIMVTTNGPDYFKTLDGSATIPAASVNTAYGVGGFVNCTHGVAEDAITARNFLPGLKPSRVNYYVTNNLVQTAILVTSVGGPDDAYKPLSASGLNPVRYAYPGTNNPNSYDLWVQLVINGRTNLICNWNGQVQLNVPLP